jgi:serine/threonine-protein kinase
MESIGKYQITGELGSGGFGKVYKALDPTVGRVVAIKVLNVQDDPGLIMRFEAEAKTSANLQHKNIVIVHEFGEQVIDERHKKQFLVMEYLSGKNLQEIINERTPIAAVDKLLIMSEVAQGLQYAHEQGVVHRDVKPANIMRLSDGSVKIMDFGIARLMRGANTRLTQAGIMIGTPQYMAPEQFTTDTADEKCDVWAYGVVFYEFLTGINPFHGDNAPQMIFRVTAEEPPPISSHASSLPRSLDTILKRLLAKSREDRYASLEDVRFDLEPVILELRRAQVQDLLKTAERLIQEGHLDEALTVVRRILDSDQTNAQARKWRRELPELIRGQALQVRIRALVEQADADAARRDYSAALEKLAEAVRLDRSNQRLRSRVDEVIAEQEKVKRAAGLLKEARAEFEQNAFTVAIEHAREAARTDPENSDAAGLIDRIGQEIQRRDAEVQRKASLNKAKGLILVQAYENAVLVLNELAERYPEDAEVRDKLDEAKRLQSAYEAQMRTDAAILESRELIRKGMYQRAIDGLESLDKEIPQKNQVSDLLSYAREQLEVEKRAAQVEDLIRQASEAPAGDFELSLGLIDRALDLAPGNEKALRLRKSVLAARLAEQENRAIRRSVQDCRALLLAGKLDEAVANCSDLKAKRPDHPSVVELDAEIERLVRERHERIQRELQKRAKEVELLIEQGNAGAATQVLTTLTVQYPGGGGVFAPLLARINALKQEQERIEAEQRKREAEQQKREGINATVSRARELAAGKRWDQALAELERGLANWPDCPELLAEQRRIVQMKVTQEAAEEIERRIGRHELDAAIAAADSLLAKFPGEARIIELRERGRKQIEFERLLKEAESLVFQGEIDKADLVVVDLLRRVPGDGKAQRLRETIQQKQKRRQDFATAEQFCRRMEFPKAHELVIRILLEDPEDAAAGALLKRIERESIAYARQQVIERARADAAEHVKHRRYAAAVQLLENLAREFPDEEDLRDDLRRTRDALAQFERKEACARERAELDALMKQRRFEDAIEKARQLAAGFPEESFQQDLQAAISAKELRDRRIQVEADVAEIEKLFRAGDAASVRQRAEKLLASYEEPRVRELLNWAKKTEAELRSIKRKAAGPRYDWRWIAAAAAALLIIGFAIWKLSQPSPVVGELQVTPLELSFSYRPGDTVPPAKTFQLTGKPSDETWLVAASDQWIKAPSQLVGDGSISVQADPQNLSVGDHTGVVTVRSKRNLVTPVPVKIRLTVLPEATQTQLLIQPLELSFSYQRGGTIPPAKSLQLAGKPADETWLIAGSASWIKVPSGRIGDGSIAVEVDPQKLKPGEYTGVVTVSSKRNLVTPVTANIRLTVSPEGTPPPPPPSELQIQPLVLSFSYQRGGQAPTPKSLQLTGKPAGETWVIAASDAWIKAPSEKIGDGPLSILVDPQKGSLGPGEHSGTVTVSSRRNPATRVQVSVRLTIQDATPPALPSVDCHSADYHGVNNGEVRWPGTLMPGQAVTIDRNNAVVAGPAGATQKATGGSIPGCDVSVNAITTGIQITEFPTAANRFGTVTMTNTSQQAVPNPRFQWRVKP